MTGAANNSFANVLGRNPLGNWVIVDRKLKLLNFLMDSVSTFFSSWLED